MTKPWIGCILENIEGNYSRNVWLTLRKAAENADCNLRVFEGRRLLTRGNDRRHNAIYHLAERFRPAGWLVMGSSIGSYVTPEEYQAFCDRFAAGAPVVSLGLEHPGTTSVLLDGGQGMRRLMEHLIRTHGYRKIAFVKGPAGNIEAGERYRLFLSLLATHRVPVDERLIFEGNFAGIDGYEAYRKLYESGMPCDCMVCVNDDTALGAYHFVRALKRKGIRPPTEHITGFDDSRSTRAHKPALTTIAQPMERMVERALRTLLDPDLSPKSGERFVFPTELIIRESCGCRYLVGNESAEEMYARPVSQFNIHQTMQTYALPDLFGELERLMPQLGIRSCFIVRFDRSDPGADPRTVPEQSELLFAYAGGVRHPLPVPAVFPTGTILPDPFLTYPNRVTDVVKPLFFRDEQYGYVVFEAQDDETVHLEELRGQISDSLMYALMMNRQKEVEADLARTVDALRESNRKLEAASIIDAMTGLRNRQGFIQRMAQIMRTGDPDGRTGRLLYLDIDRLKEVNQRVGYPAGDRMILAAAALLRGVFPPDALIGRFCGDEFAVLLPDADAGLVERLRERVESGAASLSSESGLALRIHIGCTDVKYGDDTDVETIIRKADADLYEHKRQTSTEPTG